MAEAPPSPPPSEPSPQEIRDLLDIIRKQNILLKRYIFVLGGGIVLLLLMQSPVFSVIINYAVIVAIVMVVLLTAPMWSQLIASLTDRIPWYPKKKPDRHDSAAGPV